MTISTLVRTFLHSVGTTLQDMSPQFFRWPERELVIYTNYGQMALAKYLPTVGMRSDAIKLRPGTKQDLTKVLAADIKPGDGSAAVDTFGISLAKGVMRNMGADGLTPGRPIRTVDSATVDAQDPDWHSNTRAQVREIAFDKSLPRVFWTVPGVPAAGAVWVELPWLAEPKRVPAGGAPGAEIYAAAGASAELLGVHDQFVEDLHNYVVAMALMKGSKNMQNMPKAQAHAALFTASINAQAAALTGVNPNLKLLPFAAEIAGGA